MLSTLHRIEITSLGKRVVVFHKSAHLVFKTITPGERVYDAVFIKNGGQRLIFTYFLYFDTISWQRQWTD